MDLKNWTFYFRLGRSLFEVLRGITMECLTPETRYWHFEFHCYLVYKLSHKYFRFGRALSWINDFRLGRTFNEYHHRNARHIKHTVYIWNLVAN